MNNACVAKLMIAFAGTALVVGGGASLLAQETAPAGAQETTPSQEQEEFRLTQRDSIDGDGQRVRVGGTQLIFDSIINFTDTVNDLFLWGYQPTISGNITDNAFLGGQRVDIDVDAVIGGDMFLFAQNGEIEGRIGGDLYAFLADLRVGETASVDGAMYGTAATLTINGEIGGPLSMSGGVVELNGTVRGDVNLEAGQLTLGPNAVILGDLRYESPREATIDPGAQVTGETRYFLPRDDEDNDEESAAPAVSSTWTSVLGLLWDGWWLLSSFLVGAIALAMGGESARKPAARLAQQPALGLGFGFVIAVVFPAAAVLSMILLVTIPLGLIGMAVYFAVAYLARLVAAQAIGDGVLSLVRGGRESSPYASLALGLLLFYVLTNIPYVGFLIWLAAVVAGMGGIFLATRKPDPEQVVRGAAAPPVGA